MMKVNIEVFFFPVSSHHCIVMFSVFGYFLVFISALFDAEESNLRCLVFGSFFCLVIIRNC